MFGVRPFEVDRLTPVELERMEAYLEAVARAAGVGADGD